eukprot:CAMPEP_0184752660 /NCGR_PEP_ID=MMETSP0315-20130426/43696_1 /TAXON_ID=101924 /ORGANISM="Rhodosorus marinus, Strain UTEX LB 2760" /LENGTH=454 /DNA_ID=CAMNT_0027232007 /DNA_START=40 /DNA_END=1404 /DNA_ORIENTATION=+
MTDLFMQAFNEFGNVLVLVGSADAVVPAGLKTMVADLSGAVGISAGEIKMFLCLMLAYPLGVVWRHLPTPTAKHMFSIVVGLYMLVFVYGFQWIHVIISASLAFLIMKVGGPKSRHITAAVVMLYLACMHIYRQVIDYLGWTIDVTFALMVVTQKLHGLAFNYYDGNCENPTDEQKALSTEELPSLLEFFSFLLFPSGVIMGPCVEFTDYIKFANGEVEIPAPYLPGLRRAGMGIFYFGLSQVISSYYPTKTLLSDEKFLTSGNLFTRFGIQLISLIGYRTRYYFAWKFSEGAMILSGIGFNGIDKDSGKYRWDRVEAIDVRGFDFGQSLRQSAAAWNKITNLWLKRYTYDRVPSPLNLYFAYFVSAFWHGFYPGYYMFFMSMAVGTAVHRKIRRNVRPWFLAEDGKSPGKYKGVYDFFSFVLPRLLHVLHVNGRGYSSSQKGEVHLEVILIHW